MTGFLPLCELIYIKSLVVPFVYGIKEAKKRRTFQITGHWPSGRNFHKFLLNEASFPQHAYSTARNLTQTGQLALLHFLLERLEGETLARSALAEAHRQFGYSRPTISILWSKWVARRQASETGEWDVTSDKTRK